MRSIILVFIMLSSFAANASFFIQDGSITPKKIAPKTVIRSASSGVFNVGTTVANVTNLSIVIPATTRHYVVGLIGTGIGQSCKFLLSTATGSVSMSVSLYDSTNSVLIDSFYNDITFPSGAYQAVYSGSKSSILYPANMSRTIVAQAIRTNGNSATVSDCNLYAYELL